MSQERKTQLDRFKEATCELGTDEDEKRLNEKLAKQKPDDRKTK